MWLNIRKWPKTAVAAVVVLTLFGATAGTAFAVTSSPIANTYEHHNKPPFPNVGALSHQLGQLLVCVEHEGLGEPTADALLGEGLLLVAEIVAGQPEATEPTIIALKTADGLELGAVLGSVYFGCILPALLGPGTTPTTTPTTPSTTGPTPPFFTLGG